MITSYEIQRIEANFSTEVPPPVKITLTASSEKSAEVLSRVRSVMRIVASQTTAQWPSDAEWESLLPEWFVSSLKKNTNEAIRADYRLCHWEAWLDSMKERDWSWWSCKKNSKGFSIFLTASSWPINVGPLVCTIYAVGATTVEVDDGTEF